MIGLGILDTVIGVVFVFLLVSMLVTIGNELIAAVLKSRAKWLRRGLEQLLGSSWAKKLYDHPLIYGTARPDENPSYIPSRSFANVVMDLIRDGTTAITAITAIRSELEAVLRSAEPDDTTSANMNTRLGLAITNIRSLADAADRVAQKILDTDISSSTTVAAAQTAVNTLITTLGECAQSDARDKAIAALRTLNATSQTTVAEWQQAVKDMAKAIAATGAMAQRVQQDMVRLKSALPTTVAGAITQVQALMASFPASSVRVAIANIPHERVRSQLLALFDDAENDIEKFKQNVEIWFNNAMDRVGGWYKRKTQWVAFWLAVLVAVGLNVDTLAVIRYLQTHPAESEALVAKAQAFGKEHLAAVQEAQGAEEEASSNPARDTYSGVLTFAEPVKKDGDVKLQADPATVVLREPTMSVKEGAKDVKFTVDAPVSTVTIKATITATGAAQGTQTLVLPPSLPAQFRAVQAELDNLGLPIGWVRNPTKAEKEQRLEIPFVKHSPFVDWPLLGNTVLYHIVGWLVTALAATLGAPFWFDTLNRLISIRSSGKAPEEAPKPPKEVPEPREPGKIPVGATHRDEGR
jgi:hypothetical protein